MVKNKKEIKTIIFSNDYIDINNFFEVLQNAVFRKYYRFIVINKLYIYIKKDQDNNFYFEFN